MKQFASIAAIICLLCATSTLLAQNALISIQPPDDLFVCGEDTITINVKNTSAATISNVVNTVTLPLGMQYVVGSVNGAVEQNTSNLSEPLFSVASLGPNAEQQIKIRVIATCSMVPAINSGQLFSVKAKVVYNSGMDMITSVNFKVETGFVVIVSASPVTVAAEIGQMPVRTIVLRNTRLGPISRLVFTDNHFPGFIAEIQGSINFTNSPVLFYAELDGTFFSNFGDGDEFFEFNEEITIQEKITITDCGTPSFDNPSRIRIGWGCDAELCQYDSTDMEVTILPSTQNPELKFITNYGFPSDYCTNVPSTNQVMIVNTGNVPANNVILDFYNGPFDGFTGMDTTSFEQNLGQGWSTLHPSLASPIELQACEEIYFSRVLVSVPFVPANDTVFLRYDFFTCFPDCNQRLIPPFIFTFYEKACPVGANVSDSIGFALDSALLTIRHLTQFNLMECMNEGETYNFNFTAKSLRFLTDTTYFQARLNLPKGIYWDSTCVTPTIEGNGPVYTSVEPTPEGGTTVVLSYDLPFSSDSVSFPFCLKFICAPDIPCMETLGEITQEGGEAIVYPVECEFPCGLKTNTSASIAFTPDADEGCGMSACHLFLLMTNAPCADGGGGGGGGGIPAGLLVDYQTYRTNYGLLDEDDNRIADSNLQANTDQIRLDRYIPGDTLRFELKGVVLFGQIPDFPLQINTEVLRSDFGLLDGDAFLIASGRTRFSNRDSLMTIKSHLRVKRADGTEEYECDAPLVDYKHQNYLQVQAVNVQPPNTLDQLLTMYKTHFLGAATCAPDGQGPTTGDSLFYTYEYQFKQNYTPGPAGGPPPALVNFRNVPWNQNYAWTYPDDIGWPRPMSQYSGYVQSRAYPKHTIKPCETSSQTIPFAYGIRLARGNMFPYEVRQIAEVSDFKYRIAPDATLLSAQCDLNLQEGVSWFDNEPIPWSNIGLDYSFDYENTIFELPIDEGYNLRTDFVFDESCKSLGPDTAQVMYNVTYPEAFPNATTINYLRRDGTGFLDAAPRLKANFNQTILNMNSENFELEFFLKNDRPANAPNCWMYVEPLNGTISDVALLQLPSGTAYPGLANLFQIGNISSFFEQPLRLMGKNSNCEGLKLRLIFGWDCDPVNNPFASTCGRDTVLLDLRLQNAVLELDIINQPTEIPLCEPSDYFTFEVSNANDGKGFGITSSVKLPQGLSVVPGSSQVQYPSPGGAWVNIGDPGVAPGNIYLWPVSAILPTLNGLPGFNTAPSNAFRVRFRVIAECGFVANAQPVYGVEGVQPCGALTNSLRKPDEPINLEGVSASYGVDINMSPANTNPVGCGDDFELAVQLLLQGSPVANDSIYITLPAGVTYVPGSYQPIQNAPSGGPQQNGLILQWPFSSGLSAGSVVKFNIKLQYNETAACLDKFVTAQTRQKTNGFCATINQSCSVYIATGEALYQIPSSNPDLKLNAFVPGAVTANGISFEAIIENTGQLIADNAILQLWVDSNGDGLPSAGENLIQTINYNQPILPGTTASQTGNVNIPLEDLCKLLAVLPAQENCACVPKYFPIEGLVVDQGTFARCTVEPVTIGVPNTSGHVYNWQPTTLLSCTTCPEATFTPDASVQNGDFFTFVLYETAGSCTIEHRFEIRYGEALGISTPDQVICKGDSVILQASLGGTYQWSGPGVNPTAAQQTLSPQTTTTYSVTVTLSAGCTGSDMVTVTVLEPTTINLPPVSTCAGIPATIFGEPQTAAGQYCKTFTKANGCDSTVCVVLNVAPVAGNSVLSVCQGDSVEVFPDQLEYLAGQYCKVFTNSAGCDSTHCVTLNVIPQVSLSQDTTKILIVKGASTTLNGPEGYTTYAWESPATLSCSDCPSPVATPVNDSTLYTVTVTNAGGCTGEAYYRVTLAPPCFEGYKIPNAFTPGNAEPNNTFAVVFPEAGHFEKVTRLQVYNRWGEKIYESATNPTWDGTVKGKVAPMDVYLVIIDLECNGEVRRLEAREVTVIR